MHYTTRSTQYGPFHFSVTVDLTLSLSARIHLLFVFRIFVIPYFSKSARVFNVIPNTLSIASFAKLCLTCRQDAYHHNLKISTLPTDTIFLTIPSDLMRRGVLKASL